MSRLEVSSLARTDLDEIWLFIAADNVEAADRHVERLFEKCVSLSHNPMMGRSRDDLLQGTRSFPMENYVIFYQPRREGDGVTILRVLEGHRDITPEIFNQSTLRSRARASQALPVAAKKDCGAAGQGRGIAPL